MKLFTVSDGDIEYRVGVHSGGCVTVQMWPYTLDPLLKSVLEGCISDRDLVAFPPLVLFSMRPWPGYLAEALFPVY